MDSLGTNTSRLAVRLYSKYGTLGPSSRLRMFQYVSGLNVHGIDVQISPLFPDKYLRAIYGPHKALGKITAALYYLPRILKLLDRKRWDVTWIEGELLPYAPFLFEHLFLSNHRPYVVEYDDALFHNYDRSGRKLVRRLLGKKIDVVMSGAACVIAGNEYLANRARHAGAKRVEIVPTVLDPKRYEIPGNRKDGRLTIGWIGSPATQNFLIEVAPVLVDVCKRHGARLLLIGARPDFETHFAGAEVTVEAWSEAREAAAVAEMDVGLMPLPDSPWARGKCGYKLIQYMACRVPFVASPVGVNVQIADSGGGLLASTLDEWRMSLDRLLTDESTRSEMGAAGERAVRNTYSIHVQTPRLARILFEAAGR